MNMKINKKRTKTEIKRLIIAWQLLKNGEQLIKTDSLNNTLIAIFDLRSALDIAIIVLEKQFKFKTVEQTKNHSFEMQWSILSKEYKKRFGNDLPMKTQMFTLHNLVSNFIENNVTPTNSEVFELCRALRTFFDGLVSNVFGLQFSELDYYLLIDNTQIRSSLKAAQAAYSGGKYEDVLRNSSLAFHLALEDQRQKINYLSERGLLRPEPFLLDRSIGLHLEPKDQEFIHIVLRTPPKKLEHFKELAPTTLITEDENAHPEIIVSDFVDSTTITQENAEFCLNFTLECILQWDGLEFVKEE